ncbi:hypothetical protein [Histidinibacterium aquaticum]|uniref:Colicin transporter n=1 Tax=Histidinibacterium aquaticum TaxID=2613962 RepID=A0A5J5GN52_9RHOB|nr:hypothetical protein [Histidinibacterium aquaticum]KAA9008998.1 hypothetical protein F3S47_07000 [Histidinibacterium aquaticum]
MDDVTALEGRIAQALDRIRAGVEGLGPAAPAAEVEATTDTSELEAEVTALRARLEEEQAANAQLEERVVKLKDRQDQTIARLESQVSSGRARLAALDEEMQKLRQVNAELVESSEALREAAARDVAEPHLVNKAMLAELDALRALRGADAAEVEAVLAELRPLKGEEA